MYEGRLSPPGVGDSPHFSPQSCRGERKPPSQNKPRVCFLPFFLWSVLANPHSPQADDLTRSLSPLPLQGQGWGPEPLFPLAKLVEPRRKSSPRRIFSSPGQATLSLGHLPRTSTTSGSRAVRLGHPRPPLCPPQTLTQQHCEPCCQPEGGTLAQGTCQNPLGSKDHLRAGPQNGQQSGDTVSDFQQNVPTETQGRGTGSSWRDQIGTSLCQHLSSHRQYRVTARGTPAMAEGSSGAGGTMWEGAAPAIWPSSPQGRRCCRNSA